MLYEVITMGFLMFNPLTSLQSLYDNYQFLSHYESYRLTHYTSFVHIYYKSDMHKKTKELGLLAPEYSYINATSYLYKHSEIKPIANFVNQLDT